MPCPYPALSSSYLYHSSVLLIQKQTKNKPNNSLWSTKISTCSLCLFSRFISSLWFPNELIYFWFDNCFSFFLPMAFARFLSLLFFPWSLTTTMTTTDLLPILSPLFYFFAPRLEFAIHNLNLVLVPHIPRSYRVNTVLYFPSLLDLLYN